MHSQPASQLNSTPLIAIIKYIIFIQYKFYINYYNRNIFLRVSFYLQAAARCLRQPDK
jgi:hypothetical protein